jgi:hypothetical protein
MWSGSQHTSTVTVVMVIFIHSVVPVIELEAECGGLSV